MTVNRRRRYKMLSLAAFIERDPLRAFHRLGNALMGMVTVAFLVGAIVGALVVWAVQR